MTTWERIREAQVSVIEALTPACLPNSGRFRQWSPQGAVQFEGFCEASAGDGGFRSFEIRHGGDYEGEGYLDRVTRPVVHTMELVVGYPQLVEFQGARVETIMDHDLHDLVKAIGTYGYAQYDSLGAGEHQCRLLGSSFEDRPGARLMRLRFGLSYDRSI